MGVGGCGGAVCVRVCVKVQRCGSALVELRGQLVEVSSTIWVPVITLRSFGLSARGYPCPWHHLLSLYIYKKMYPQQQF